MDCRSIRTYDRNLWLPESNVLSPIVKLTPQLPLQGAVEDPGGRLQRVQFESLKGLLKVISRQLIPLETLKNPKREGLPQN